VTLRGKIQAVVVMALLALPVVAMAANGKLGFDADATFSGFINPVLKRLKVTTVVADSPAAVAGLKPDDYIVEVNGQAIEDTPARVVATQLKDVPSGQHLHLKLKRGDSFLDTDIVAGP